jgi:hypothetical protein
MHLTELPRALAPWAEKLALFPRDIALALAPLLPRLHGVLGASGRSPGESGEPDGYDGIARRGTYERLLASEWLLLSEIPDEFLRRVAAGEHAFLRLARRPPSAGRHGVVLFDAGPDQLGAPRIAHLAALIVLAARLEQNKGTLLWGVLQDEISRFRLGINKASLQGLFHSRSPRPVETGDLDRWLAAPHVGSASERWLVAAEDLRLAALRASTSALLVAEIPELGARRVHVTVCPAGPSRQRTVVLDLPPERECVRLLRDPFGLAVSPRRAGPPGVDIDAGMVFSEDARRLYLRGRMGELITVLVPNSARMPVPPPAVFSPPAGQTVVAAGFNRNLKRTMAVCCGQDRYFLSRLSKSSLTAVETDEHPFEDDRPMPAEPAGAPLQPLIYPGNGTCRFVDAEENVIVLAGSKATRVAGDSAVTLVKGNRPRRPPMTLELPPGTPMVGALTIGADTEAVLLDDSRTRVELFRKGRGEVLFTSGAPIHRVHIDDGKRLIGFFTDHGEVGVYSLRARQMVSRLGGGSLS